MGHISGNTTGAGRRAPGRSWKRLAVLAAPVAALAWAGFALSGGASVTLGPSGPQPTVVTVGYGDTLQFVNTDKVVHGITSSRPELNMPTIAPGATYTTILTGRTATYPFRQTGGKSLKGDIVSLVAGSVSLTASKAVVLYGQPVNLGGVSTFKSAAVSLQRRLRGERGYTQIRALTSAPDGTYSSSVVPAIGAKYRATVAGGQILSPLRSVDVKPVLTIASESGRTKAGHRIKIRAQITPRRAATRLTLLACNTRRGAEIQVAVKRPGPGGGVVFVWPADAGKNLLRVVVSHHDGTPGYVAPSSKRVTVIGVGKLPKLKHHAVRKSC